MTRSWIQTAPLCLFTANACIFSVSVRGREKIRIRVPSVTSGGMGSCIGQVCPFNSRFMVTLRFWLQLDAQALWGLFILWLSKPAATLMPRCLPGLQPLTPSRCPSLHVEISQYAHKLAKRVCFVTTLSHNTIVLKHILGALPSSDTRRPILWRLFPHVNERVWTHHPVTFIHTHSTGRHAFESHSVHQHCMCVPKHKVLTWEDLPVSIWASLAAKPHSSSCCHFLHLLHWRGVSWL